MSIIIKNVSPSHVKDNEPNEYILRINDRIVAEFEHIRDDGLAVCLRKAAEALEKKEQVLAPVAQSD